MARVSRAVDLGGGCEGNLTESPDRWIARAALLKLGCSSAFTIDSEAVESLIEQIAGCIATRYPLSVPTTFGSAEH
jgi:hypothetical protein